MLFPPLLLFAFTMASITWIITRIFKGFWYSPCNLVIWAASKTSGLVPFKNWPTHSPFRCSTIFFENQNSSPWFYPLYLVESVNLLSTGANGDAKLVDLVVQLYYNILQYHHKDQDDLDLLLQHGLWTVQPQNENNGHQLLDYLWCVTIITIGNFWWKVLFGVWKIQT